MFEIGPHGPARLDPVYYLGMAGQVGVKSLFTLEKNAHVSPALDEKPQLLGQVIADGIVSLAVTGDQTNAHGAFRELRGYGALWLESLMEREKARQCRVEFVYHAIVS